MRGTSDKPPAQNTKKNGRGLASSITPKRRKLNLQDLDVVMVTMRAAEATQNLTPKEPMPGDVSKLIAENISNRWEISPKKLLTKIIMNSKTN